MTSAKLLVEWSNLYYLFGRGWNWQKQDLELLKLGRPIEALLEDGRDEELEERRDRMGNPLSTTEILESLEDLLCSDEFFEALDREEDLDGDDSKS